MRSYADTGGFNVYPREVEELLRTHPGVADAAVVGLPSERWGETVAAFVVPAESAGGLSDLEAWCADRLVGYKRRPQAEWTTDTRPGPAASSREGRVSPCRYK